MWSSENVMYHFPEILVLIVSTCRTMDYRLLYCCYVEMKDMWCGPWAGRVCTAAFTGSITKSVSELDEYALLPSQAPSHSLCWSWTSMHCCLHRLHHTVCVWAARVYTAAFTGSITQPVYELDEYVLLPSQASIHCCLHRFHHTVGVWAGRVYTVAFTGCITQSVYELDEYALLPSQAPSHNRCLSWTSIHWCLHRLHHKVGVWAGRVYTAAFTGSITQSVSEPDEYTLLPSQSPSHSVCLSCTSIHCCLHRLHHTVCVWAARVYTAAFTGFITQSVSELHEYTLLPSQAPSHSLSLSVSELHEYTLLPSQAQLHWDFLCI